MLILDCTYDGNNDWSSLFSFWNFCKTSNNFKFHVHVNHLHVITLKYLSVMLLKLLKYKLILQLILAKKVWEGNMVE